MAGGGAQLQAFLGCSEGYLAILGLGLEDEREPCEICLLQPQFERNEPLFRNFSTLVFGSPRFLDGPCRDEPVFAWRLIR